MAELDQFLPGLATVLDIGPCSVRFPGAALSERAPWPIQMRSNNKSSLRRQDANAVAVLESYCRQGWSLQAPPWPERWT
jgi:hypothetical protein